MAAHVKGLNSAVKADRERMNPVGEASRDPKNFLHLHPCPEVLSRRIKYNGGDEKGGWKKWCAYIQNRAIYCKGTKGKAAREGKVRALQEAGAFTLPDPPQEWIAPTPVTRKANGQRTSPGRGEYTKPMSDIPQNPQPEKMEKARFPLPPLLPKDSDESKWLMVALVWPEERADEVLAGAPSPAAFATWCKCKEHGVAFEQLVVSSAVKVNEKRSMSAIEEGRDRRIEPCMEAIDRLMESLKANAKVS